MNESPKGQERIKNRRVFEIARELKRDTPTIMTFLENKGYDVKRKQMTYVDEEMYVGLLHEFDRVKYQKYQSEHSTDREAVQKRDMARLRKEEKEELLSIKRKTEGQKTFKKLELPKYEEFILQQAKIEVEDQEKSKTSVEEKAITTTDSEKTTPKAPEIEEIKKVQIEQKSEKITEKDVRLETPKEKPSKSSKKLEIQDEVALETPTVIDKEKKKQHLQPHELSNLKIEEKGKIELPKPSSLKIIEQAPKKPTPKPPESRKVEKHDKVVSKPELKQAVSKEKVETSDKSGPGKRSESAPKKLEKSKKRPFKRKRIRKQETLAVKTETKAEVPTKTVQEASPAKAVESDSKSKESPSKKKPRRKGKADTTTQRRAPQAPRGRRRKKVSAKEVADKIKETMAADEGKGKKHKRHADAKGSESTGDIAQAIKVTEFITTQELGNLFDLTFQEIIQKCLSLGMIISINQRLDKDTIELLAAEFDFEVEFVSDEVLEQEIRETVSENHVKRSPVVTIMGHVDHGKTTLLDFMRKSSVVDGEVGGITQHIGAYEVSYNNEKITFLDTPGHEAFTAMRARGAQITDIVILVVAADDKVMPQTIEAIDHAKAAGTQIVVAVNKMDKPEANSELIYKQLADNNVLVEKWGGKYQSVEISAKFGEGIEALLTEIVLAADMLELKADPTVHARGVVIESRLDKGLGAVATILIQSGTLKTGNPIVAGESFGRVRAMYNEKGDKLPSAGPATPIQVVGFNGVPQAGDNVVVYSTEKEAREVSQKRSRQHREVSARRIHSFTLEQASKKMREAELQNLQLLIKGDVHGSVEVLSDALMKLSTSEVKVDIIHHGVGGVTESDVLLAAASGAIIIGFHVRPNMHARELARKEGVEIRLYRIIHEVVDEIRLSMEGLLAPLQEEKTTGIVEVRQVFKISRHGTIAGSYVTEGKIARNSKVRLIRDDVEKWSGSLTSLKRFKDDAKEVLSGFECGIALDGFKDVRENDRIEVYEIFETKRTLE